MPDKDSPANFLAASPVSAVNRINITPIAAASGILPACQ